VENVLKQEKRQPTTLNTPSDLTLQIMRGDLRQIYCKIQTGDNINEWDQWISRLKKRPESTLMIWEDGTSKVPISILCRNVLLWLNLMGLLSESEKVREFVDAVFTVRDLPSDKAARILATAWENSVAKHLKD